MARNYYDDSYEEYDEYEDDSYDCGGYEWTEERFLGRSDR